MKTIVRGALGSWFVAVFAVGAADGFVRPGQPPLSILFSSTLPLAAFLAAYFGSRRFRDLVLSADVRLLSAVQAWRAGGLVFLAFYAYGLLPGLFAWPAGLGDMAIGLTAPWIAAALTRDARYAAEGRFAAWNVLGILDLVVAVGTGTLSSGLVPGLTDVRSTPMSHMPLVLIPAFLVPLFVMLHLTALFQWWQARRAHRDLTYYPYKDYPDNRYEPGGRHHAAEAV
jgi:uncharacterized membrane protein YidH (DUF202 family)